MAARKRLSYEPFDVYRENLKAEEAETQEKLSPRVVYRTFKPIKRPEGMTDDEWKAIPLNMRQHKCRPYRKPNDE